MVNIETTVDYFHRDATNCGSPLSLIKNSYPYKYSAPCTFRGKTGTNLNDAERVQPITPDAEHMENLFLE